MQTFKGLAFIALTGSLIFFISRSQVSDLVAMRSQAEITSLDLIASEARFRGVFEHSLMGIAIADRNGNLESCNAAYLRLMGYSMEELKGRHYSELLHPDDRRANLDFNQRLQAGELSSFQLECRYTHRDGHTIVVRKVVGHLAATPRVRPQMFAFVIDITEERQVLEALRSSELRLRHVMDMAGEGMWDWATGTDTVLHSAHWSRLLMLDPKILDHSTRFFNDIVHPDDRDRVFSALAQCRAGEGTYSSEHRLRRADGTYIWVQDRGKVIERGPDGEAMRMIGSFVDITDRRTWADRQSQLLAEVRASASQARQQAALFRGVFEGSLDCMVLSDLDRNILSCNSAFEQVFGYESDELNGICSKILYAEADDWSRLLPLVSGPDLRATSMQLVFRRKNGSTFPGRLTAMRVFDSTWNAIGIIGIIRDISVEKRREEALKEKRHLEALGRLTGGIAHDFNNLLTVVSANLQLMEMRLDDDQSRHCIAEALSATEMGARLNQRLMTFARQRELAPVAVNVNELVTTLLQLVRRAIGESIEIETDLDAERAVVMVDASELENAIVNLALNARDAMPKGGTLLLQTRNVEIGCPEADAAGDVKPGSYIRLTVSDTGFGMSEDVRTHAFDPFFTTKEPGKGTGLGLTTIHGFVKQSGGLVTIASRQGAGTCVSLSLPLLPNEHAHVEFKPGDAAALRGHGEVILLVEDNTSVRTATAALLEQLGYHVVEAEKGITALEMVESSMHIDVVLSDIVMPGGMSGFDLAQRLHDVSPDLCLVLTSGFPDTAHRAAGGTYTGRILLKPYTQQELAMVIRDALEATVEADIGTSGSVGTASSRPEPTVAGVT